jgi:2-dehydro-3-deoxy-D-gluconate 5-dehydrogenase
MILEEFRLDEKIALVTGGTRGLGRGIAIALAEAGADIAVVSRSPNKETEREVLALGRRYFHYPADLTVREQTRKVVPVIVEKMGDLDILVNNSGILRRAPAIDYSEEDWNATLEVDLTAPFLLSQAAGRIMLKKGKGKIINIASVLSFQGGSNVAYVVSKHGVVGLTRALANDWAGKGINVNALAPGWFATELNAVLRKDSERYESIVKRIPAGRWGALKDIAGAAVFLASPASDFVHGEILVVDGGWMTG